MYVFVTAVYYIHVYHDVFLQSLLDVYTDVIDTSRLSTLIALKLKW